MPELLTCAWCGDQVRNRKGSVWCSDSCRACGRRYLRRFNLPSGSYRAQLLLRKRLHARWRREGKGGRRDS